MVLLLLPPPTSAQMPWNLMFDGQITPVLKCSKSIAIFAPKNHKLWVSRVPALRFPTNEPLPNPTDPNSHWENLLGCLGSKFWDIAISSSTLEVLFCVNPLVKQKHRRFPNIKTAMHWGIPDFQTYPKIHCWRYFPWYPHEISPKMCWFYVYMFT